MCTFVPHDRSPNRTPAHCVLPGKLQLQPSFRSSSIFPACVQVNERCSQTNHPHPPPSRTGSNKAGTAWQPSPATKSTFGLYPLCRECHLDPQEALELEYPGQLADRLSLTAINVLTPRCLREALLQSSSLSETSARSFPEGQA